MHEVSAGRQAIETMIRSGDLEGLLRQAEAFHGHLCPGVALGVKAGQYAMDYLDRESRGWEEVVAIVDCNNCFVDGLQVVTGCTLGNNGLIYRDLGKTAVTVARRHDGAAVRLAVKPDFRERLLAKYATAGPLFDKVMVQQEATAEEHHRFQHLWEAISRRELKEPLEEQFVIQTLTIQMPPGSRMFATVRCSRCGEGVMEPKARLKEGQTVCRACAGESFPGLTGRGVEVFCPDR